MVCWFDVVTGDVVDDAAIELTRCRSGSSVPLTVVFILELDRVVLRYDNDVNAVHHLAASRPSDLGDLQC